MIGYSPKFPLQFDATAGAYAATKTLREVAKQNFINLMLTSPGERVMDINFGAGLRQYLFEQKTSGLLETIASNVREQVRIYLPFIQLNAINFNTSVESNESSEQVLEIRIDFSVPALGSLDTIVIGSTV